MGVGDASALSFDGRACRPGLRSRRAGEHRRRAAYSVLRRGSVYDGVLLETFTDGEQGRSFALNSYAVGSVAEFAAFFMKEGLPPEGTLCGGGMDRGE